MDLEVLDERPALLHAERGTDDAVLRPAPRPRVAGTELVTDVRVPLEPCVEPEAVALGLGVDADRHGIEGARAHEEPQVALVLRREQLEEGRHGSVVQVGSARPDAGERPGLVLRRERRQVERAEAVQAVPLLRREAALRVAVLAREGQDQRAAAVAIGTRAMSSASSWRVSACRRATRARRPAASCGLEGSLCLAKLGGLACQHAQPAPVLVERRAERRSHVGRGEAGRPQVDGVGDEGHGGLRVGADLRERDGGRLPQRIVRGPERGVGALERLRQRARAVAAQAVPLEEPPSPLGLGAIDLAQLLLGPARRSEPLQRGIDAMDVQEIQRRPIPLRERHRPAVAVQQGHPRAAAHRLEHAVRHRLRDRAGVLRAADVSRRSRARGSGPARRRSWASDRAVLMRATLARSARRRRPRSRGAPDRPFGRTPLRRDTGGHDAPASSDARTPTSTSPRSSCSRHLPRA